MDIYEKYTTAELIELFRASKFANFLKFLKDLQANENMD